MSRWIVSFSALIVVSSAFAAPAQNYMTNIGHTWDSQDKGYGDDYNKNNSYCDTTPKDCNPKPPTNCVPEPASFATLAVGGIALLRRKKKQSA